MSLAPGSPEPGVAAGLAAGFGSSPEHIADDPTDDPTDDSAGYPAAAVARFHEPGLLA